MRKLWPHASLAGCWFPVVLTMSLPCVAAPQVGTTTDIITGVVVDDFGNPLAGVVVEAMSLETEITRSVRTDSRGRYTILFPDGAGQYQMTARMIGMAPAQAVISRFADEDRLVWDVRMVSQAIVLDSVVVSGGRTPVQVRERPSPGGLERNLTPDQIASLPIDLEDMNVLAALVPGVVAFAASDSTAAAFSVAGQRSDANVITLDGMRIGSGEVPQEGVRNTRVVTSTYDVSRGGFSGGMIAATTRSGSNRYQGSVNYSLRNDALAFETGQSSAFTRGFSQHVLGLGVGGPVFRNRLLMFASGQARVQNTQQPSLTTATPVDFDRLGLSADSVDRFVSIVDDLGAAAESRVESDRSNDNLSGMLRLDYLISNSHTLTLRGDLRGSSQAPTQVSPTALPETGGENETAGAGVMAGLASRLGTQFINEARVFVSRSTRDGTPYMDLPQGRVQVASDLDDGSVGVTNLSFGGNSRMPVSSISSSLELADEISWLPGLGAHRFKLGGSLRVERASDDLSSNQLGVFRYNSLADLETGSAASFQRMLTPAERRSDLLDLALYAGDTWRASRSFQLTYGLRLEHSSFRDPPPYNSALDASLGVRTDRLPSETALSPRVGFSWTVGGVNFMTPPDLIVRGGIGSFRSTVPTSLIGQTHAATGLASSLSQINCVGAAVPVPEWRRYSLDPAAIPGACVGESDPGEARIPSATAIEESFSAPRAWRASLGIERYLTALLRLSVNASYARGVDQYGFRDLNLDTSSGFSLPQEAGRPVFVEPDQVVPGTGAISWVDSRVDTAFAQVVEVVSALESETKQLTISLGGVTRTGVVLQTSYTLSDVRDQSSQSVRFGRGGRFGGTVGGFSGNNTAGNPNVYEWARSSFERKHSFLGIVSYPFGPALDITAIGRLNSGIPYTPMVAGDINGDGARNDRAFVFDPAIATSPAVSAGMQQLLANASGSARSCLEHQLGTIAERNSCTGPWEASLDLQLNYRPGFWGLNNRMSISMVTMNLLRGIDELVHGADGAVGWGQLARPDETLLFVTGFDEQTNSFEYTVNERFGATGARANAVRTPFQLGIQVRATFGPDRGRDALSRMRGGGGGRGMGGFTGGMPGARPGMPGMRGMGPGALGSPEEFLARFETLFPNPADVALGMRDTLMLTDDQVEGLIVERDTANARSAALAAGLREELEAAGEDPRALMRLIRPVMQEARQNVLESLDVVRRILSAEQWELLPEEIRDFGSGRQRGVRRPD